MIPTRQDQRRAPSFDRPTYRRRNVVERCIGWLKGRRRLATRFEKLAENFLAMVKLAMLERLHHPNAIDKLRTTIMIPYRSTTRPYAPRLPRRS